MHQSNGDGMKVVLTNVLAALALAAGAEVCVRVDPSATVGPIKPMNAVNNGPSKARADQSRGNFSDFRVARFPYARTHDSINQATSGGHTVDISAVFPDFDADENDPKSYDFAFTDVFLETILAAGTEPFFRLGQTIENGAAKKYHVFPPKDFAKWARVCEHVIRHCNEGWCDGHRWNIRYWEIWNEADAQPDDKRSESCQWQGTKAEFFEFYRVVAQHLKKAFPQLRIGGPALGFRTDWAEEFLAFQEKAETPIDFFSWHLYTAQPSEVARLGRKFREMLDRHGYGKAESILDEWNYLKGWTDEFPYTCRMISDTKGAAFAAAALSLGQTAPIDMLMYYDARPGTVFNGLFDLYTLKPRPAYSAFLAWSWLRDLGMQVSASVTGAPSGETVVATAAQKNGRTGVLVTRYTDDDNRVSPVSVRVFLPTGASGDIVRGFVTDGFHAGAAKTFLPESDGSLILSMLPNSFVYLEVGTR